MNRCEIAIVGGGPAGLQCALLLGRARRDAVVYDAGEPRNGSAREAHGFFSRDGIAPDALLETARAQLARYENVRYVASAVETVDRDGEDFVIVARNGERSRAKRLVIATGMRDGLPGIEGLDRCWGISAFVCPYCDGWEVRDEPLAAWGNTRSGVGLAQELHQWSRDLVVFADVSTPIADPERAWLQRTGTRIEHGTIAKLHHDDGALRAIELENGRLVERAALFFSVRLAQCCGLGEALGCRMTERGHIDVDVEYRTSVPGIYAVGDAVTHMHQIVFAAASGARAAIAINTELSGIA